MARILAGPSQVNEDIRAVIAAINIIRADCNASVVEAHAIYGLYLTERNQRLQQEHNELHQRESAQALANQTRAADLMQEVVDHA